MLFHTFASAYKRKKKKRIGRGGKRGTYSGKGQKGQKARAGHRIKPAERLLISKFPKFRGVKNKPLTPKAIIIKTNELKKYAKEGVIDYAILKKTGVIKRAGARVKILDNGAVEGAFTIKGISVSKKAKEKIEKAGGKIIPHPSRID